MFFQVRGYLFRAALTALCGLAAVAGSDGRAAAAPASASTLGSVLERVRAAGEVVCGVDQTPGFSRIDADGRAVGFDVDFCRAIAAAVLGDADAIRTARVNTRHKFLAVERGELDVAFGMTTWTFSRDTTMGAAFPVTNFYDGQGVMVWDDAAVRGLDDIGAVPICVQRSTTSEANLADFLKDRPDAVVVHTSSSEEKFNAFAQRLCLAVTGDRSELAVQRAQRAPKDGAWRLLPGSFSREPLGPLVDETDPQWTSIVRWTILATLVAEARGVGASTIATATATDEEMANLLG